MINDWNEKEVKRAEKTWGGKFPKYTLDMFNFAISSGKSYLDLGCGFGRFLQYLDKEVEDPNYIGYDSSEAMIDRIRKRFPDYFLFTFLKELTTPITHTQEVILSSAVLIHLTIEDQNKILANIAAINPNAVVFDINCPNERQINKLSCRGAVSFERIIMTGKFRMTWQSHYDMTKKIIKRFPKYNLTIKFYDLKQGRHKVVYMLKK